VSTSTLAAGFPTPGDDPIAHLAYHGFARQVDELARAFQCLGKIGYSDNKEEFTSSGA
jgi:hypothetical protein